MKILLYPIVLIILAVSSVFGQSVDCSSAPVIAVGSSCNLQSYNVDEDGNPGLSLCGTGTGYSDGWFQFTATDITTTITVDSDAEDFMLAVFEVSCSGSNVHCENVVGGNTTTLNLATVIGTDYFIQLQRTSANGSGNSNKLDMTGNICIYSAAPVCDDLIISTTTFSQNGLTTCGSGDDLSDSDACGSFYMNGEDFVIEYTPNTSECVNIALTNTDSWTGVFLTDECPNSGSATCLGNATSSSGNPTLEDMDVIAGQTYYITVSTYPSPNCTPFDIDVTACPPPPANDDCSNAITVPVNADDNCGSVTAGTINNATASSQTNDCFGTANDDVWYEFTATNTVHYIDLLNISGSPTDMYHSVYQSNCGSIGSAIECSDPNGSTVSGLTPGNNYFIRIYSYSGSSDANTNFDLCVGTPPPPPANDDCSGAITVPVNADDNCGTVTPGTINGATESSQPNDCSGTANNDVWYEFTATSSVHYIDLLNISGSPTDMYHSVYQSNCGSIGSAIECSDPNGSTVTGLTPGDSYFIRIYSYSSSAGANTDFDLCVGTPPPPPANDECSGAISVTVNPDYLCGSVTSGSLSSATASSQTNDCFGTANDDVWYEFTATNSSHTIDLNNVSGSTTDLYHSVYQSNCGSIGSALECSDPNSSTVTGLTPGDSYFIRIYSYSSLSGANTNFDLCVGTPPPPPANDDCSGAIPVTVNTDGTCSIIETGSIGSATASSQTNDCGGTANDDVWYSFIAQETSQNINLLDITGSTTDMYFSVYEGSCGSPGAALLCSDDNFNTVPGLTIGNQYFVRVYSWSGTSGATSSFDLCISNTPPEPDNITCGDMNPICSGSPIAFTASSGGGSAPAGNDYDCLTTQPNPTWFYLEIDGSGDLSIDITAGSDVDYSIWGPFNDLATAQSNCGSFLAPSDCSYSISPTEQANIANVNAGEVYVLLVTNYADVVQSIFVSESSSNTASTDCSGVPLPVELIDFTAQPMGEEVLLSWSTASETSCDYYEIQRSTNGQVWETVGFKEGNGNTNMISKYTYRDAAPLIGISYYRLKQYDFDGAFELLPIRSVQFMNDEEAISLYPNPAKNSVKVSAVKFKIDKIVVHSSTGKAVRTIQDIDEEIISIDVNQIPAGVYFIEVRTQDGSTHRRRLVIY